MLRVAMVLRWHDRHQEARRRTHRTLLLRPLSLALLLLVPSIIAGPNDHVAPLAAPSTSPLQTPVQFMPSTRHFVDDGAGLSHNWLAPPTLSWVSWVVVASTPPEAGGEGGYDVDTDAGRAAFLRDFDPDVIDWTGGMAFNRADFARLRGIASSGQYEYEYEESLQFTANDTRSAFESDGMSRDEHNNVKLWGTHSGVSHYYMELNAPKWKETVLQGDVRSAFFGDVVTQDNIGSPINKALANFDDCSNARFLNWLARRCAATRCHPALSAVLRNTSFNIRDHVALVRAKQHAQAKVITTRHVAMETCGSNTAPSQQNLELTSGVRGQIKFEGGLCLTSRGAKNSNPGDIIAERCSLQHALNQSWTLEHGVVIRETTATTDCAGHSPCCLTIMAGKMAVGTPLGLCGCSQLAGGCTGTDPAKAGLAMHLSITSGGKANLVANASGLCVTSSVDTNISVPTHDSDFLVREPVLHEYIRHGFISALQNWDDIAASVRSSQQPEPWLNTSAHDLSGGKRAMAAIWGNQYGLSGGGAKIGEPLGGPVATLMTQTSDVSWYGVETAFLPQFY